jgi:cytochrome c553
MVSSMSPTIRMRARSAWWCLALCAAAKAQPTLPDSLPQRLAPCAACHGEQGEGLQTRNEYNPRLAGKPAGYLFNQLVAFRDKRRSQAIMNYTVAHLSDAYLREIAEHYAALQPPLPAPRPRADAQTMALGERLVRQGDAMRDLPSCASCHGASLTGVEPATPGLVGLNPPYIGAQLGAWQAGQRHALAPDCMQTVARKLTPADIAAITAYLAALPLPADTKPAAAGSLRTMPLDCGGVGTATTR